MILISKVITRVKLDCGGPCVSQLRLIQQKFLAVLEAEKVQNQGFNLFGSW
jgi:hypothetical protein